MKSHKYTTIFSSKIKPVINEDKDKYLALASMIELSEFIPELDTEKNIDLLPIAFNACVANRVNKNDDVVDTDSAIYIHKNFINKPINIEHNRNRVVGTILTASFSEFGTDNPISEEEAQKMTSPFNITLGGVVWRTVNSDIADIIEDSGDPTSEDYMKISASWELGFSEYDIVAMEDGDKNLEDAHIYSDAKEIEEMEKYLKSFGGSGKLKNGKKIYRKVKGSIIPLGIGLTEAPAAEVKGIAIKADPEEEENGETEAHQEPAVAETHKEIEKISQINEKDVNNHIEVQKMKIESINDITEDSLKTLTASQVSSFVEDELKKASKKFHEDKVKFEEEIENSHAKFADLEKTHEELKSNYDSIKEKIDSLEAERIERENLETFNIRMASMDEDYNLDDEDRKVLAGQIKDLDGDSFDNYKENLTILLRSKLKANEEAEKVEESKKEETKVEAEASSPDAETEAVVEEAIDNAEKSKDAIPVSAEASDPTVFEKYKQAFNLDQFEFRAGRR